jgi:hypothetical protein
MASVLVTGFPGAGKSSVATELQTRGLRAIDTDNGISRWEDPEGKRVEVPANPDMAWLLLHHCMWVRQRLDRVLAACSNRSTALCGAAYNTGDYLPRFDLVILLQIDDDTMVRRLTDPRRSNEFGKTGATLEWSLDRRSWFEAEVLKADPRCVDARMPLAKVADEVIGIVREHGIDLSDD